MPRDSYYDDFPEESRIDRPNFAEYTASSDGYFVESNGAICTCRECARAAAARYPFNFMGELVSNIVNGQINGMRGMLERIACLRCLTPIAPDDYYHDRCGLLSCCCECRVCSSCDVREDYSGHICGDCNQCTGCCNCCDSCGAQDITNCPHCENCVENCCRCIVCERCELVYFEGDTQCRTCRVCYRCQEQNPCSHMVQIRRNAVINDSLQVQEDAPVARVVEALNAPQRTRLENQPFHKVTSRTQLKGNPSKRLVAAEIEVCGVAGNNRRLVEAACKTWGANIVSDGSLPSGGFEINTAPAAGDLWLKEIKEICTALTATQAWVDGSAGCHVHIDARDFSYYDLRRLLYLYEKVEPIIFSMVPADRRNSTYCVPCGERYLRGLGNKLPKESKDTVLKNVYGTKGREAVARKRSRYDQSRYNALNIHSFFVRGTVECRIHPGTVSETEITNWGMMWEGILDFAYRSKEKDIVGYQAESFDQKLSLLKLCSTIPEVSTHIDNMIAQHNSARSLDILASRFGTGRY